MDTYGKSDKTLLRELGGRLKQLRLNQNLSQEQVARAAGVGRTTVVKLEGGQPVTLLRFVQVLRALGALEQLDRFLPEPGAGPLQLLELKGKRRRRASSKRSAKTPDAGESAW